MQSPNKAMDASEVISVKPAKCRQTLPLLWLVLYRRRRACFLEKKLIAGNVPQLCEQKSVILYVKRNWKTPVLLVAVKRIRQTLPLLWLVLYRRRRACFLEKKLIAGNVPQLCEQKSVILYVKRNWKTPVLLVAVKRIRQTLPLLWLVLYRRRRACFLEKKLIAGNVPQLCEQKSVILYVKRNWKTPVLLVAVKRIRQTLPLLWLVLYRRRRACFLEKKLIAGNVPQLCEQKSVILYVKRNWKTPVLLVAVKRIRQTLPLLWLVLYRRRRACFLEKKLIAGNVPQLCEQKSVILYVKRNWKTPVLLVAVKRIRQTLPLLWLVLYRRRRACFLEKKLIAGNVPQLCEQKSVILYVKRNWKTPVLLVAVKRILYLWKIQHKPKLLNPRLILTFYWNS